MCACVRVCVCVLWHCASMASGGVLSKVVLAFSGLGVDARECMDR
jgi:hypothetical protein